MYGVSTPHPVGNGETLCVVLRWTSEIQGPPVQEKAETGQTKGRWAS